MDNFQIIFLNKIFLNLFTYFFKKRLFTDKGVKVVPIEQGDDTFSNPIKSGLSNNVVQSKKEKFQRHKEERRWRDQQEENPLPLTKAPTLSSLKSISPLLVPSNWYYSF